MFILPPQESSGQPREMHYMKDPGWEDGNKPSNPMAWRVEQLEFRRLEIYETFRAFSEAINTGSPGAIQPLEGSTFDWSGWKGQVECTRNVLLTGHSFGSATVVGWSHGRFFHPTDSGLDDNAITATCRRLFAS